MVTSADCQFCRDLSGEFAPYNFLLIKDADVAIFSDSSPIAIGHVLVCPSGHFTSFGNTPNSIRQSAFGMANRLIERMKSAGYQAIVSEHGTGRICGPTNACCDHAHLHVLPIINTEVIEGILEQYIEIGGLPETFSSPDQLGILDSTPYNLLSTNGQQFFIWRNTESFHPQCFREFACSALGYSATDNRKYWQLSVDKIAASHACALISEIAPELVDLRIKAITQVGKLVRDGIPTLIATDGRIPISRILQGSRYLLALGDKIREELLEFEEAPSHVEAADLLEAVICLLAAHKLNLDEVEIARVQTRDKKGAFAEGIFLEMIVERDHENAADKVMN